MFFWLMVFIGLVIWAFTYGIVPGILALIAFLLVLK